MNANVALLTDRRYVATSAADGDWYLGNILQDDGLLQDALRALGLTSARVDWSDPHVNWSHYRCAVFRTTWDYFERFDAFNQWLRYVDTQTRAVNPISMIRWNMDKHYLGDLSQRGVPIVPSHYIERGSTLNIRALLDQTGWDRAVVKPCVSGAARHTYRVDGMNALEVENIIQPLLREESFILQPFQDAILKYGEDSLMLFGGRYSHAVRKIAKPGDFRVQDDHGGTVHHHQATTAQIELAERAMAACESLPIYGRVDMIADGSGGWSVMEMELIEPELWLRFHPPAAIALAQAIASCLQE